METLCYHPVAKFQFKFEGILQERELTDLTQGTVSTRSIS